MTIRDQITALCQDVTISDEDLVTAVEKKISELIPFDHKHDNKMDACGIHEDVFMKIAGIGKFSQLVERVEKSNSKRVLAYIFTKEMLEGNFSETSKSVESLDDEISDFISNTLGMGSLPKNSVEATQSRCEEEDASECWKCPIKDVCTKFKN